MMTIPGGAPAEITGFAKICNWFSYIVAFAKVDFGRYFFNSVIYSGAGGFCIILISSIAAYAFSRLEFFGKKILFYFLIFTFLIFGACSLVSLRVVLKDFYIFDTRTGLLLFYISNGLAFTIFVFKKIFDKLPKEVDEAAVIDGCSRFGIYWRITIPLARPALIVLIIINFVVIWNDLLFSLIVINDKLKMPLQEGLWAFQRSGSVDYPLLMASLTMATIPMMIMFIFMQKHIKFLSKLI
ncbi:MAG: carbohydrate ABC transporter permease [Endomicrobium sp.]|nr:carbohydrate ABC transporter permease [Endomicrobium sp.]